MLKKQKQPKKRSKKEVQVEEVVEAEQQEEEEIGNESEEEEIEEHQEKEPKVVVVEKMDFEEVKEKFKSNMFHLQTIELLSELTPNYHKLSTIVDSHLDEITKLLKLRGGDDNGEIMKKKWKPPTSLNVIGSIAAGTAAMKNGRCTVDIAASLPAAWFRGCDLSSDSEYSNQRDLWTAMLHKKLSAKFNAKLTRHHGRSVVELKFPEESADLVLIPAMAQLEDPPNTVLAEDSLALRIATAISDRSKECRDLRDAAVLLRAWMRRRWHSLGSALEQQNDGVTPFFATLLLANLVTKESGNRFLSSYQLFRLFLSHVSSLSNDVQTLASEFSIDDVPLASNIDEGALKDFVFEARATLSQLDNDTTPDGGFEAIFLTDLSPAWRFDCILRVRGVDDVGNLISVLERGIGSRCHAIRRLFTESVADNEQEIVVGIILDPETCLKIVERGPSADDLEASKEFRDLWGDKTEVRRFKDGTIIEATVWDSIPPTQRHQVVESMCEHLIKLHFGKKSFVHFSCSQLDHIIPGEEDALPLICLFESLSKRLCTLALPLKIKSVQPINSALRYTDVCFPQANAFAPQRTGEHYIASLRGVIRTVSSRSWPDELEALQHVKAAFYVQICNVLTSKLMIAAFPYDDHIEIIFKGHAFFLTLHCQREISMLQKVSPLQAERLRLECIDRPLHAAAIHALALKCHAYPKTVRLAKRWMHSHMFSHHISEEAIELLVARCFTGPSGTVPESHITGFYRFLKTLGSFSSKELPALIIVDFHNDATAALNASVLTSFEARRGKEGFPPSLFISTSYGHKTSVFTSSSPSPVVLRRMITFASRSAEILETLILGTGNSKPSAWNTLFTTPLSDYSFLIHLKPQKLPRLSQALPWQVDRAAQTEMEAAVVTKGKRFQRYCYGVGKEPPLVGFDPASLFFEELVKSFGDLALFFHNSLGGDVIAAVWRPSVLNPRQWKGPEDTSCIEPVIGEPSMVKLNVQEVLRDIELLGSGIIDHIENLSKKIRI